MKYATTNSYAEALRVFADPENYPIYFHCFGGADHTGMLAFLLEGLCGVDAEDVCIDYELTTFGWRRAHQDRSPELMCSWFGGSVPRGAHYHEWLQGWRQM